MLQKLIDGAKEELRDWAQDETAQGECVPSWNSVCDYISECADSNTPAYYSTMMGCAKEDFSLMHERSEIAGEDDTPMRLLQLNIYDRIEQELHSYWEELKEEIEEDLENLTDLTDELDTIAEDEDLGLEDAMVAWEESSVPEYLEQVVSKYVDDLFPEEGK